MSDEYELLFGVDVSHSQGEVDFRALATSELDGRPPFRFAIVKASEGGDYEDPNFATNWAKLLELDPSAGANPSLIRGVYHFARPDNRLDMSGREAGETEARWFCQLVQRVGGYGAGCLPPFLDWEKRSGTATRNREWLVGFTHVVRAELGRAPGLYTGPGAWKETTDNWEALVGELTLWQVQYQSDGWDPSVSGPSRRLLLDEQLWPWQLWQWSGGGDYNYYRPKYGEVPGIPGGVADIDRFDGTLTELRTLALLEGDAPASPELPGFVAPPIDSLLGAGIFPHVDLARFDSSERARLVAVVQGLLLAAGHGPDGLLGSDQLPDGKAGPKTLEALETYKRERGLASDTTLDANTWWSLLRS